MNSEKATNVFWLAFGLLIMEESYRLNLGELHRPDSGLFPFIIGLVITILSTILFFQAFRTKFPREEGEGKKQKISYKNIFLTLLVLYAYALTFMWLGFIPATFLLVLFLLKIVERKGWALAMFIALSASLGSYLVFEVWLQAALPKGVWGG